jgi:hypothetical protein
MVSSLAQPAEAVDALVRTRLAASRLQRMAAHEAFHLKGAAEMIGRMLTAEPRERCTLRSLLQRRFFRPSSAHSRTHALCALASARTTAWPQA